jgi:hypothetical protein
MTNWSKWLFYTSIGANMILAGVIISQNGAVRRAKNDMVSLQTTVTDRRTSGTVV